MLAELALTTHNPLLARARTHTQKFANRGVTPSGLVTINVLAGCGGVNIIFILIRLVHHTRLEKDSDNQKIGNAQFGTLNSNLISQITPICTYIDKYGHQTCRLDFPICKFLITSMCTSRSQ